MEVEERIKRAEGGAPKNQATSKLNGVFSDFCFVAEGFDTKEVFLFLLYLLFTCAV